MDWFMGKGRRKDKDCPTPPAEEKQYLCEEYIKERITDADFFKLVSLPAQLDYNEWLATHTMSFFNHVNLMYGVISEYCTSENCPSMGAPGSVQYLWYDDKGKKYKYSAPQYIDYVMTFIQKTITDETVFPTKFDHSFPSGFDSFVKKIHRFLLHVFAHIYHAHYRDMTMLGLHGHLNSLFTHFMVLNMRFDLLEDKDIEVLQDLITALIKSLPDPNQNERTSPDPNQNDRTSPDPNQNERTSPDPEDMQIIHSSPQQITST